MKIKIKKVGNFYIAQKISILEKIFKKFMTYILNK